MPFSVSSDIVVWTGYLPTLYDFHFDGTREKWISWTSLVPKYKHDPEMKFSDILGNVIFVRGKLQTEMRIHSS